MGVSFLGESYFAKASKDLGYEGFEIQNWLIPEVRSGLNKFKQPKKGPDTLNFEQFEQHQLDQLEKSIKRGVPLGNPDWQIRTAEKMNLQSTLKPRGRPKKGS